VASIAHSTAWGTGASHAEGGGTRKVDTGAVAGAPGEMMVLARSLKRESTPFSSKELLRGMGCLVWHGYGCSVSASWDEKGDNGYSCAREEQVGGVPCHTRC
jgi:hypothetical protein